MHLDNALDLFDLKSDVPKINTNLMLLFHGIFEKKNITLMSIKIEN